MTGVTALRIGSGRLRTATKGVVTVALCLGLLGCATGTTTTPSATPPIAPSASPAATAAATTPPATQAGPVEPCTDEPGCQMLAGEYHASNFDGGITFRLVGDAWTKVAYAPEILSLQSTDDWVVFMSGELHLPRGDVFEMSSDPKVAQDLVAKLAGITVTPAESIEIDGHDAVVFDVAKAGGETVTLWWLGLTSGQYLLDPGVSVRMHWVDMNGTPFILALEAPTPSFESFLADAQPVIDSIAFD